MEKDADLRAEGDTVKEERSRAGTFSEALANAKLMTNAVKRNPTAYRLSNAIFTYDRREFVCHQLIGPQPSQKRGSVHLRKVMAVRNSRHHPG